MPERRAYPSDLSDAEWNVLASLLPPVRRDVRPRKYTWREIINAILYVLRSGCVWRLMPHDLPPWRSAYNAFRDWRKSGLWERLHDQLRGDVRQAIGKEREPSAAIIDSQSVKTAEKGGPAAGMAPNMSTVASVTSWSTPSACCSGSSCIPRTSRIAMAHAWFWKNPYAMDYRACASSGPTPPIPGQSSSIGSVGCAPRIPWNWRSCPGKRPSKASRSCPGAGSSSAPSDGWAAIAA